MPSLVLFFYNGWNDTDGKDETIAFDETTNYTLENDASEFWDNWIGTHFPIYSSSGVRISDPIDLSIIGICTGATISWVASTPTNATLTVETNFDDNGFIEVTNGGSIPGITSGMDLTGKNIIIKQSFTSSDNLNSVQLDSLQLEFSRGLNFTNDGKLNVKPILEITKNGNGSVSILNLSTNEEFLLNNLVNGEIVTIYNEEEIIQSTVNSYPHTNFNDNYLDLAPGTSTLKVTGSCTIVFKWQFTKQ